jgi:hypothetical protein
MVAEWGQTLANHVFSVVRAWGGPGPDAVGFTPRGGSVFCRAWNGNIRGEVSLHGVPGCGAHEAAKVPRRRGAKQAPARR